MAINSEINNKKPQLVYLNSFVIRKEFQLNNGQIIFNHDHDGILGMHIAGDHVASGYGFSSQARKDYATYLADTYMSIFSSIENRFLVDETYTTNSYSYVSDIYIPTYGATVYNDLNKKIQGFEEDRPDEITENYIYTEDDFNTRLHKIKLDTLSKQHNFSYYTYRYAFRYIQNIDNSLSKSLDDIYTRFTNDEQISLNRYTELKATYIPEEIKKSYNDLYNYNENAHNNLQTTINNNHTEITNLLNNEVNRIDSTFNEYKTFNEQDKKTSYNELYTYTEYTYNLSEKYTVERENYLTNIFIPNYTNNAYNKLYNYDLAEHNDIRLTTANNYIELNTNLNNYISDNNKTVSNINDDLQTKYRELKDYTDSEVNISYNKLNSYITTYCVNDINLMLSIAKPIVYDKDIYLPTPKIRGIAIKGSSLNCAEYPVRIKEITLFKHTSVSTIADNRKLLIYKKYPVLYKLPVEEQFTSAKKDSYSVSTIKTVTTTLYNINISAYIVGYIYNNNGTHETCFGPIKEGYEQQNIIYLLIADTIYEAESEPTQYLQISTTLLNKNTYSELLNVFCLISCTYDVTLPNPVTNITNYIINYSNEILISYAVKELWQLVSYSTNSIDFSKQQTKPNIDGTIAHEPFNEGFKMVSFIDRRASNEKIDTETYLNTKFGVNVNHNLINYDDDLLIVTVKSSEWNSYVKYKTYQKDIPITGFNCAVAKLTKKEINTNNFIIPDQNKFSKIKRSSSHSDIYDYVKTVGMSEYFTPMIIKYADTIYSRPEIYISEDMEYTTTFEQHYNDRPYIYVINNQMYEDDYGPVIVKGAASTEITNDGEIILLPEWHNNINGQGQWYPEYSEGTNDGESARLNVGTTGNEAVTSSIAETTEGETEWVQEDISNPTNESDDTV